MWVILRKSAQILSYLLDFILNIKSLILWKNTFFSRKKRKLLEYHREIKSKRDLHYYSMKEIYLLLTEITCKKSTFVENLHIRSKIDTNILF